jgi:hypothetical protein
MTKLNKLVVIITIGLIATIVISRISCGKEYDEALDVLETSYNQEVDLIEHADDKFEVIKSSDVLDLSNKIDSMYSKLNNALSDNKLNDDRLKRFNDIQLSVLKKLDMDTTKPKLLTPNELAKILFVVENIPDKVTKEIESRIASPLSRGLYPPKLDEKYMYVPQISYDSKGTNYLKDAKWQVQTLNFSYSDDGRINLIKLDGEQKQEGVKGIIWGDDNKFTIYIVLETTNKSTRAYSKTARMLNGELDSNNNIIKYSDSFVMLDKKNDKEDEYMDIGSSRIFKSYNNGYVENVTNKKLYTYYIDFLGYRIKTYKNITPRTASILKKRDGIELSR